MMHKQSQGAEHPIKRTWSKLLTEMRQQVAKFFETKRRSCKMISDLSKQWERGESFQHPVDSRLYLVDL